MLPLMASSLLVPTMISENMMSVKASSGEILMDVDTIQALSHKDGMTVDFINDDMKEMWATEITNFARIKELYEYNTDIQNYGNVLANQESVRNLYNAYDDFKPINNVLRWKSSINASSFDVVVSLNDELTEVVYSETGLKETSYTMENPLSNTHYYWQITANTRTGEKVKSRVFDFVSGNYSRTIDIGGVSNTRDIGGVETKFGTLKQGLVYRSARLEDIDAKGKASLTKLNIQTDLDIREDGEGAKNPAKLNNYYLKTLKNYFQALAPENRTSTIECLKVFTNVENYPIDYHCAVGRDRTGTLTAILLGLFGASEDYIYHEYFNSLFSVSGAYQKDLADLNFGIIKQTVDELKNYGDGTLVSGVEAFLAMREDSVTHQMVGLTSDEIQTIRDIFAGKIETPHSVKPFVAEENYKDKCFVTFKCIGKKDVVKLIDKGSIVTEPYAISSDKIWLTNGKIWNKAEQVDNSLFIYADYKTTFNVTLHFIGINRPDENKNCLLGDVISFDNYAVDGYLMSVITDQGKQVSKLKIERNTIINIIYSKK